jgi:hypothetical protein
MTKLQDTPDWLDRTLTEVGTPAYEQALAPAVDNRLPEVVDDWLGRLRLLYGVPFSYLVPDARLLPAESIRFFYLDRNWTDRLVDGALSIGKLSTREQAHHQAVDKPLRQALDDGERRIRIRLRGLEPPAQTGAGADLAGLLLRSAAVSGWPGLEVRAERDGRALTLLRLERLAPDCLFCLFQGIPTRVEIEEPGEGLPLGCDADDDPANPSGLAIDLRHDSGEHIGRTLGDPAIDDGREPVRIPVPVRAADPSVLHIAALRDAVAETLGAPVDAPALALQLLQPPYCQRFEGSGSEAPTSPVDKPTSQPKQFPFARISELAAAGLDSLSGRPGLP